MSGPRFPWWGMMILLFLSGCDETADLCDPRFPAGRIQGRVSSGGLPMEARISAQNVDQEYPYEGEFIAEPDETGFYSLDLPSGRYVFQLDVPGGLYDHTASGLSHGPTPPDTVLVGAGIATPEINFNLGGLTVDFDLPREMHGQYGMVTLHTMDFGERDSWRLVTTRTEEIVTGTFELEMAGILPGEYQVELALGCPGTYCGSGVGERFWMPGTHDQGESPIYTIAPDSVLSLDGGELGNPARLEGRISGAWLDMGIPQAPRLYAVTEDSLMVLRNIAVEEDGSFASDFLVPAPVKLRVSQFKIDCWIGGPSFEDATVFALESGQTITGIEHVQSGIHLVVDETGLPLEDGKILIYNRADLSLVATIDDWLDTGRHIAIPNLWPGEFLIYMDLEPWRRGFRDWRPQWFDRAPTVDTAEPILLTSAGQVARRNLVLEMGGVISGRLIYQDEPVRFFSTLIYFVDEATPWADNYFGTDGFSMTGLPDGDYVLGARAFTIDPPVEEVIWYPGTLIREEATIIQIRDAAVIEGADIIVPQ